jgi:hypothetical protein
MLKELQIESDNKESLVLQFTNGRSVSRADLTFEEAANLERHLNSLLAPVNEQCNRMRRKILARFHEMGYRNNGSIDMEHVQATVLKYGYLHKRLNDYTAAELPKLVSQVDKMRDDFMKSVV